MYKFSVPLIQVEDQRTNLPAFALFVAGKLIGPEVSDADKSVVQATDLEQLKALNELVDAATQDALNAGCAAVQEKLGIATGDVAGVYFSGPDEVRPVAKAIADYIAHEIALANNE